MTDQGHVFVVRGKLESVHCDAVIVPTGHTFGVGDTWSGLGIADQQIPPAANGFLSE
ncbi:hypothetical protein V3G39_17825 (plasmid) [Dermatophilaceae bacterium Sec6.4]